MPTDETEKIVDIHDVVSFTTYDGELVDGVVRKVHPFSGNSPPSVDLAAHIKTATAAMSCKNVPFGVTSGERYRWTHKPAKPILKSDINAGDAVEFHHEGLAYAGKVLRKHPT